MINSSTIVQFVFPSCMNTSYVPLSTLRGRVPPNRQIAENGFYLIAQPDEQRPLAIAALDEASEQLAVSDTAGALFLVSLRQNRFARLSVFNHPVSAMAFLENLLIVAAKTTLHVFDTATQELKGNLEISHRHKINSILRFGDSAVFAAVSPEVVTIWDASAGCVLIKKLFSFQSLWTSGAAGDLLLLGRADGRVCAWNRQTGFDQQPVILIERALGVSSHISVESLTCLGEVVAFAVGGSTGLIRVAGPYESTLRFKRAIVQVSLAKFNPATLTANKETIPCDFLIVLTDDGIVTFIELLTLEQVGNLEFSPRRIVGFATTLEHQMRSGGAGSLALVFADGSVELLHVATALAFEKRETRQKIGLGQKDERVRFEVLNGSEKLAETPKHTKTPTSKARPAPVARPQENKFSWLFKMKGPFDPKLRPMIWAQLLRIPQNIAAYETCASQGIHPEIEKILQDFPLHSAREQTRLLRLLSCLVNWEPLLLKAGAALPRICFPFVSVLGDDPHALFEIVATFLAMHYARFFDFHPYPPLHILGQLVDTLYLEEPQVAERLAWCAASESSGLGLLLWGALQGCLSDILTRNDWLTVFDYSMLHKENPSILLTTIIAWLKQHRTAVLKLSDFSEAKEFFKQPRACNPGRLLHDIATVKLADPNDLFIEPIEKSFAPLTSQGTLYEKAFNIPVLVQPASVALVADPIATSTESLRLKSAETNADDLIQLEATAKAKQAVLIKIEAARRAKLEEQKVVSALERRKTQEREYVEKVQAIISRGKAVDRTGVQEKLLSRIGAPRLEELDFLDRETRREAQGAERVRQELLTLRNDKEAFDEHIQRKLKMRETN